MKCSICDNANSDNYYVDKYDEKQVICEECLLEIDGMTTSTETYYYLDGEYMGSDVDYDSLIENILCNTFYKKENKK